MRCIREQLLIRELLRKVKSVAQCCAGKRSCTGLPGVWRTAGVLERLTWSLMTFHSSGSLCQHSLANAWLPTLGAPKVYTWPIHFSSS